MQELLQHLKDIDLDGPVHTLLGFLETVDPCFLGLIVGVLVFIGSRMVSGQPSVQGWGLRIAASPCLPPGSSIRSGMRFRATCCRAAPPFRLMRPREKC